MHRLYRALEIIEINQAVVYRFTNSLINAVLHGYIWHGFLNVAFKDIGFG